MHKNSFKKVVPRQPENMSTTVSGIVNSTVGVLCNKLRDYTAQRFNQGSWIQPYIHINVIINVLKKYWNYMHALTMF